MENLEFNVFEYNKEQIIDLEEKMFNNLGFDIERNFLVALQKGYNDVPFHNAFHACDVTQMVYIFLRKGNLQKILTEKDILSLMISALGHDILHPGKKTRPFILEKKSLVETLRLLDLYFPHPELKESITQNILATDISSRYENITQIIIKMADISNSIRPYYIADLWFQRIQEEQPAIGTQEYRTFVENIVKPLLNKLLEILENKAYWTQFIQ